MRLCGMGAASLLLLLCGCERLGVTSASVTVIGGTLNGPSAPIEIAPEVTVGENDIQTSGFHVKQSIRVRGPVKLVPTTDPFDSRRPATLPAVSDGKHRVLGRLIARSEYRLVVFVPDAVGGPREITYPTVGTLPVTIDGKETTWRHLQPLRWIVLITDDATSKAPTVLKVIVVD